MVWAGRPVASESLFAARPVGETRALVRWWSSARSKMARTNVVLPVPGWPVMMVTRSSRALRMARRWLTSKRKRPEAASGRSNMVRAAIGLGAGRRARPSVAAGGAGGAETDGWCRLGDDTAVGLVSERWEKADKASFSLRSTSSMSASDTTTGSASAKATIIRSLAAISDSASARRGRA